MARRLMVPISHGCTMSSGLLRQCYASVAAELLKTSRVRTTKQARFQRGLMMTVVSFIVLGGEQVFRSIAIIH